MASQTVFVDLFAALRSQCLSFANASATVDERAQAGMRSLSRR
jgi:hypothetical protein